MTLHSPLHITPRHVLGSDTDVTYSCAITSDGSIALSASGEIASIWDLRDGASKIRELATLHPIDQCVLSDNPVMVAVSFSATQRRYSGPPMG